MTDPPDVLLLSGDLMFASKVRVAVDQLGGSMSLSGRLPADDRPSLTHVVLDLSTRLKLVADLVEACRQHCPDARVIAYGPHVQVDKLRMARDAGVGTVLTNGQFSGSMIEVLQA